MPKLPEALNSDIAEGATWTALGLLGGVTVAGSIVGMLSKEVDNIAIAFIAGGGVATYALSSIAAWITYTRGQPPRS